MTKFTPGPWLRDGTLVYALHETKDRHGRAQQENKFSFFIQGRHDQITEAELEAIAQVASAAPDMFEALQAIQKKCAKFLDIGTQEDHGFSVIKELACAALLKASAKPEGEE